MADSKQSFTPGPWTFKRDAQYYFSVYSDAGQRVATASDLIADKGKANAQLISAAPDLLAALKDLADYHSADLNSDFGNEAARMHRALEAIAKAGG